jgi:C1A family cysteine protease
MAMDKRWAKYKLGGCLFEATPSPAPQLQLEGPTAELPSKIDLRPLCSPVEDQETLNSCAANAVVGAMEYHRNLSKLPPLELSRLYAYYNARKLAARQDLDEGTFIHHAMAAILAFGVCEERMWPYQTALVNQEPTRACYSNATRYEAIVFGRVDFGLAGLRSLAAGLPIVFGAYFPEAFYHEAARTRSMPLAPIFKDDAGSGHAMLIVGYDLKAQVFIVRNSWGPDFADGGYCYIPFETMMAYAHPEHFWFIGKLSDHRGVTTNGYPVADSVKAVSASAGSQAAAPQSAEQAVSVLRKNSVLRDKLSDNLAAAKKGFRDRLRGPGAGGGY